MKIFKNTFQVKKIKILIIFDDMIADVLINKKVNPIVTELFIGRRKLNIALVFVTKNFFFFFFDKKNIRLNPMHYFIMKIPNKQEVQQIQDNHS